MAMSAEVACQLSPIAGGLPSVAAEDANVLFLRARIKVLQEELDALRGVVGQNNLLEASVVRLQQANKKQRLAASLAQKIHDEASKSSRRQNEFLIVLTHELRNLLTPIGMAASLLETTHNASPQLNIISRQARHMARLLDDLLDVARITGGDVTMVLAPILLADVIEEAIDIVRWRLESRRQLLHVHMPQGPVVINGDQVRLIQVFSNLLINASKFTPDGGNISITATTTGVKIIVAIQDDGIGIDASLSPHIFELFTQGPESLASVKGGLGVGLNVVRNLVCMHHGEVDVFSDGAGQGSTFTVTLPLSAETHVAHPASQPCIAFPASLSTNEPSC